MNVNENNSTTPTMDASIEPKVMECSRHQFMCDSGLCISKPQLCDGLPDCPNGEDEKYCPDEKMCGPDTFRYLRFNQLIV